MERAPDGELLLLDKLTLAELEEDKQSLDRLRRWHRELALRDVFHTPSAQLAAVAVKGSTEASPASASSSPALSASRGPRPEQASRSASVY